MLLADVNTILDRNLLQDIGEKLMSGTLAEPDFDGVFTLFAQMCNHSDALKFDLKGYTQSFQFELGNLRYVIQFENGTCRTSKGRMEQPNLTFRITMEKTIEILTGQVYSAVAHMNGDIDYTGLKNGAIRFQGILDAVLEEVADGL